MTAFRDQLPGDALYSAVEFKLFLHSLDRGEFSRVLLQKNLPGIRQRVYRVAHTVNQSRAVEGLVIQNLRQIGGDGILVGIIRAVDLQIVKHLHNLQIRTAVPGAFQGRHGSRHGGVCIRPRGGNHMGGKGAVVTAAVLRVQRQRHVQNSGLQAGKFAVLPQHIENVFRHGIIVSRRPDQKRLVLLKMAVGIVGVHRHHRHLGDQLQRLAQNIRHGNVVRVSVVGVEGDNTFLQGIHQVCRRRF